MQGLKTTLFFVFSLLGLVLFTLLSTKPTDLTQVGVAAYGRDDWRCFRYL